ncbi:MAG: FAD-dependent oxidoreductase [Candidatus Omnitrophica bacterium]|nr:FAD-dependent oxidoreductase [Candidatus Omnitrophota bacterium]
MKRDRAVILGGGFAGLSAAVALADAGWQVTVCERRNGLGGRARSFADPASGDTVDNGQHVFLACYEETLEFLKRLGTLDRVAFQKTLEVAFVEPGRPVSTLRCPAAAAPWHLILGLMQLSGLSLLDKLKMCRVLFALRNKHSNGIEPDSVTVESWLAHCGQSNRSRKFFWDPLAIAALNELPESASAAGWVAVLGRMFAGDWKAAQLGLASVGLSDLYATQAAQIVESKGGAIRLSTAAVAVEGTAQQASGIRLASGELLTADAYLATLPPQELDLILPEVLKSQDPGLQKLTQFTGSSIISINLWLDRPIFSMPFVGLIGTRVQWVFNRPALLTNQKSRHLALVISAADAYLDETNDTLIHFAWQEVQQCIPAACQARILRSQVVRERNATVKMPVGSEKWRPGSATRWPNLFLAGDWTRTGLPPTIESAVASGRSAAVLILLRQTGGAVRRP